MFVKEKEYEESISYLEEIAQDTFIDKIKNEVETIAEEYYEVKEEKKKLEKQLKKGETSEETINLEKYLQELSDSVCDKLGQYKKSIFYMHYNRVLAYKFNIDFEKIAESKILILDNKDEILSMAIKAEENINKIMVTPTILSVIKNCSRQYINYYVLQGNLKTVAIGSVKVFKLFDILK